MRDSVKSAFFGYTDGFEGYVPHMYLDVKQLVTVGRGDLIDPVAAALDCPFMRADGSPATLHEVQEEWIRVKSLGEAGAKGGHLYAAKVCQLHLTREGVDAVSLKRLAQDEAVLRRRFPAWDLFCADAQLGIISMDWAMGSWFKFPKFVAAANVQDWDTCVKECHISELNNAGVHPRNLAQEVLFRNASVVYKNPGSYDPAHLYYPQALTP